MRITRSLTKKFLPQRNDKSNKYDFGKVVVIAGSYEMSGALILSAKSALKSGAGLLYACVVDKVKNIVSSVHPEAIFLPCGEGDYITKKNIKKIIELKNEKRFDLLLIGPGLGNNEDVRKAVIEIIKIFKIPSVIDADALNALSKTDDISFLKDIPHILTPHMGEAKRFGFSENIAENISKKTGGVVVLKDYITVISYGKKKFILDHPNSALSKAGSGDVLSGIIAGLWVQIGKKYGFSNKTALEAAISGVYLHSVCGKLVLKKKTPYSVLASDLINEIDRSFKFILK